MFTIIMSINFQKLKKEMIAKIVNGSNKSIKFAGTLKFKDFSDEEKSYYNAKLKGDEVKVFYLFFMINETC